MSHSKPPNHDTELVVLMLVLGALLIVVVWAGVLEPLLREVFRAW